MKSGRVYSRLLFSPLIHALTLRDTVLGDSGIMYLCNEQDVALDDETGASLEVGFGTYKLGIDYIGTVATGDNETTYTFADTPVGKPWEWDREILIVTAASDGSGSGGEEADSLTVNGNAATKLLGVSGGASQEGSNEFWIYRDNTLSFADIAVTYPDGRVRAAIHVYNVWNAQDPEPHYSLADTGAGVKTTTVVLAYEIDGEEKGVLTSLIQTNDGGAQSSSVSPTFRSLDYDTGYPDGGSYTLSGRFDTGSVNNDTGNITITYSASEFTTQVLGVWQSENIDFDSFVLEQDTGTDIVLEQDPKLLLADEALS